MVFPSTLETPTGKIVRRRRVNIKAETGFSIIIITITALPTAKPHHHHIISSGKASGSTARPAFGLFSIALGNSSSAASFRAHQQTTQCTQCSTKNIIITFIIIGCGWFSERLNCRQNDWFPLVENSETGQFGKCNFFQILYCKGMTIKQASNTCSRRICLYVHKKGVSHLADFPHFSVHLNIQTNFSCAERSINSSGSTAAEKTEKEKWLHTSSNNHWAEWMEREIINYCCSCSSVLRNPVYTFSLSPPL